MNSLLLALQLTCSTNGASLRFVLPPQSGSWALEASNDLRSWRVVESGYTARGGEHVSWTEAMGAGAFYRVEWWAVSAAVKQSERKEERE